MKPLQRAALAGAATGLRSTVALAVRAPARFRAVAIFAVAGEIVVDKLPQTPSRLAPGPLAGRAVLGSAAGALAAGRRGAAIGLAAALVSARVGHDLRGRLSERPPSLAVAAAEDAVALSLARLSQ